MLSLSWTRRRVLKFLGMAAVPVVVRLPQVKVELDDLAPNDRRVITEYGLCFRMVPGETTNEQIVQMALDMGDSLRDHYWREMAAAIRTHYSEDAEQEFWLAISAQSNRWH